MRFEKVADQLNEHHQDDEATEKQTYRDIFIRNPNFTFIEKRLSLSFSKRA